MCGIAALAGSSSPALVEAVLGRLGRRGPDQSQALRSPARDCWLCAAVLNVQGSLTAQPLADDEGNLLLWNGEVFAHPVDRLPSEDCDSRFVARLLGEAVRTGPLEEVAQRTAGVLSEVQGPFAFVLLVGRLGALLCGRDPFGRRSLLALLCDGGVAGVSSVSAGEEHLLWEELSPDGVFFSPLSPGLPWRLELARWPSSRTRLGELSTNLHLPRLGPEAAARAFVQVLVAALGRRLRLLAESPTSAGRVGVLFSGGVDSTLLAAALSLCLPPEEPIDLVNVSFLGGGAEPSPDRLAGLAALLELRRVFPSREFRLVMVDVSELERRASQELVLRLIRVLALTRPSGLTYAAPPHAHGPQHRPGLLLRG